MIELRSDTFTEPTAAMLAAMTTSPLGDDCYGEDPTVNRLEVLAADRLGKAAACLMPSGTMANLTSILAHAPRGSRAVVGTQSDIYLYEAAGAAVCGGIGYEPVENAADGTLPLAALMAAFPEDPADPQVAPVAVVCMENTQNRCGGVVLPADHLDQVATIAHARGAAVHLDGARIFNAAVAQGVPAADLARPADSVQFCLSKALSAPIGSIVAGDEPVVGRVRRLRKLLGGGMRQAGVVAAAGIVALTEMVDRLAEDHAHARLLAEGLGAVPGVEVIAPQTNIVLFGMADRRPDDVVAAARAAGVAIATFGAGRVRAVTHRGIDRGTVEEAVERLSTALTRTAGPA
jgi:threonine aldolase